MLNRDECQRKLFKLGIKLGISPKLIATKLLTEEDKQAMLCGDLTDEALEAHVKTWMASGMPDYAHGGS
jgi:hypothetical protein